MKKKNNNIFRFKHYSNIKTKINKKKSFEKVIENNLHLITHELNLKKNAIFTLGKKFKINFSIKDLKSYKKFSKIVIIGMGGSILGAQAVYDFFKTKIKKQIFFVNNLEASLLKEINTNCSKKNTLFILISKSGNTIETLSSINTLNKNVIDKKNAIVITTNETNQLLNFAKSKKIKIINHRSYVSGRYSIFSETSLVPLYFMDIQISQFRKDILDFLNKEKKILKKNLLNMFKIYESKKINSIILMSYFKECDHFLQWLQQLIAESLGKNNKGILPVTSLGPKDHHSLLQLYLDGPKDKFFYIFSQKDKNKSRNNLKLFSKVLNNKDINQILFSQKEAFLKTLKTKKISYVEITINNLNSSTLGKLFSYFILETIIIGRKLNLNPFNQPAVESVKKNTKRILFNQ